MTLTKTPNINKRNFLKYSSAAIGSLSLSAPLLAASSPSEKAEKTSVLQDITASVDNISAIEHKARVAKAQQLMQKLNIAALILEPGAAMTYFSGIQWWRSERLTCLVIPREGDIAIVCPAFEQPSIRESMMIGDDVRIWQEHESPFIKVQSILKDRGLTQGKLAFEHSVRYFVLRGIMATLPAMQDISGEPVTQGCRMFKSKHELQLMHKANEITLTAYAHVWPQLEAGMTGKQVNQLMHQAQSNLGGSGAWTMALFDQSSALPHGTKQPQKLASGSIVLMDCGCNVHGYRSDVSRTFVFGEATKRQRDVWKTVRQGQQIVFDKARPGTKAGLIDDAVRQYYQSLGYGPGYQTPGLSHRTGHGIGMETHESVNFVHGEQTELKAGMCFSNEPGLYIPGHFGVRLEDCIYITDKGPQWFTEPAESLEQPIGKVGPAIEV
jgi:Xaa-Pro dipeptidase